MASQPEETISQLIRDLASRSRLGLLLSDKDVFTTSAHDIEPWATILPSAEKAGSPQAKAEFNGETQRKRQNLLKNAGASASRRLIELDRGSLYQWGIIRIRRKCLAKRGIRGKEGG